LIDCGNRWRVKAQVEAMNSSEGLIPTQPQSVVAERQELGHRGEELAAAYLQQQGYRIVAANFVVPVGRNRVGTVISVELDLVAYEAETLCFVEVKTRESAWFAAPQANVDRRKQRQIVRAAHAYRRMFDIEGEPYRYDVVTVVMQNKERPGPDLHLLRNYFGEGLLKRSWSHHYYD
jgi:putative endonuclease